MNIKTLLGATVLAPALISGQAAHAASHGVVEPGDIVKTWAGSFSDLYFDVSVLELPAAGTYKVSMFDLESTLDGFGFDVAEPLKLLGIAISQNGSELGKGSIGSGVTEGSFTFIAPQAGDYTSSIVGLPDDTVAILDTSAFEATVSFVPVPPAVWLFGSAVVGLAALGRSRAARKAAAAA